MEFHRLGFTIPTGATTVTVTTYNLNITGLVHGIFLDWVDTATGADLVVTGATTGTKILTVTNMGVADKHWFPRGRAHDFLTGDDATQTDEAEMVPVFAEGVKFVVTAAVAAETGTFYLSIVSN